jgi:hypothetical protein
MACTAPRWQRCLGADLFSAASARAEAGHIYDLKPKARALSGQGQERHPSLHERRPSQMDLFDPKPTLKAPRGYGSEPRTELRDLQRQGRGHAVPESLRIQKGGQVRHGHLEHAAAHFGVRRRHRTHPLDVRRACQSRARAVPHAHGPHHLQSPVDRSVGGVRTGDGQSESARVRGARRSKGLPINGIFELAIGVAAAHLSGHALPRGRHARIESGAARRSARAFG